MRAPTAQHLVNKYGINIILCSDFHQFSPVAHPLRSALFFPEDLAHDSDDKKIGRGLYKEFITVVQLTEQMRVTDPEWTAFLRTVRYVRVEDSDIEMLFSLKYAEDDHNNFPDDAPLVRPKHGVRKQWNDVAVEKHCRKTGRPLFICPAEDRIHGRDLSVKEEIVLESHHLSNVTKRKQRQGNDLAQEVGVAIGMKLW